MPDDIPVDTLLSTAEASLAAASNALLNGDTEIAADCLECAIAALLHAGSDLLTAVNTTDITTLESSIARILRALAERFGIFPEDHAPVLALLPEAAGLLDEETKSAAEMHQSVSGVHGVVRSVYDTKDTAAPEMSEEEADQYISAGKLLIDLLSGQRTLTDAVFSENGAYDAFSEVAAPYLIGGAEFAGGSENAGAYEEKIPEMLAGPIKRLVELLVALLTSAFMSGLLLLILRRLLSIRKIRPGIVDNVIFVGSVASLVAANLSMFIDGAYLVTAELQRLREILQRTDGGIEIPVE